MGAGKKIATRSKCRCSGMRQRQYRGGDWKGSHLMDGVPERGHNNEGGLG